MGRYALSNINNTIYDINEWELNHLNETPYCPVCKDRTYMKSNGSVIQATHFSHYQGSDCPTIPSNRARYQLLSPTEKDYKNGEELLAWARINIFALYMKCKSLLDNKLKYKEFGEMLNKATNKDIWYYKGLTFKTLPYVLLVNYGEFSNKEKSKGKYIRNFNVQFILDKNAYNDDVFLTHVVTHVWKVENENMERIEIEDSYEEIGPWYMWTEVKKFMQN